MKTLVTAGKRNRYCLQKTMKYPVKKSLGTLAVITLIVAATGLLLPEYLVIPVQGAKISDWNSRSFWFHPWGRSGVHKGIDIFAKEGTAAIASCSGLVVFAGSIRDGGNCVSILGPKWRIHYYAHLKSIEVKVGDMVSQGREIGSVGATGNAVGKPPHLHYSIISQIPYIWRFKFERFGFDRMFYLNPDEKIRKSTPIPRRISPFDQAHDIDRSGYLWEC
jgi:murein DD-endopeptidase MepM/ murein hydrolase activator NlpD